ncbi:MAG TPA: ribosome maturation factor RimM [Candidatus Polarisedimenticolia bacterium]|jgi:16S rRNA processing protein RimM|nr:ribosome maturation factor RimM [Candidatus Polarisedimenticolia bacterium]
MTEEAEFVTIARVAKTQGRHGEVAATLLTDFPELFETRKKLFALSGTDSTKQNATAELFRRKLDLDEHWFHKGMVVLKFAGVDSISDAEMLVGSEIQIPRSERAALGSDEFYVSDLIGCTVTDSGQEVGRVRDVQFGSGEAPLLVIEGGVISGGVVSGKKEYLVPFAAAYIEKIALEQKRLEMKLPEGLLELDAPLNQEEKQRQHKKS